MSLADRFRAELAMAETIPPKSATRTAIATGASTAAVAVHTGGGSPLFNFVWEGTGRCHILFGDSDVDAADANDPSLSAEFPWRIWRCGANVPVVGAATHFRAIGSSSGALFFWRAS